MPITILAIALSAIFLLAGVMKFASLDSFTEALRKMGFPYSSLLAFIVPLVEVSSAIAILSDLRWLQIAGALTMVFLSASFVIVVMKVLRDGASISCNCFGSVGDSQVTKKSLYRNTVLFAASLLLAGGYAGNSVSPIESIRNSVSGPNDYYLWVMIGLLVSSIGLWFLMIRLLSLYGGLVVNDGAPPLLKPGNGEILDRPTPPPIPKLPVGASVSSDLMIETTSDGWTSLAQFLGSNSHRTTLVFVSASCPACEAIKPVLRQLADNIHSNKQVRVGLVTLNSGDLQPSSTEAEWGGVPLLIEDGEDLANIVNALATPSAITLDQSCTITNALSIGAKEIADHLRDVINGSEGGALQQPTPVTA